MFGFVFKKSSCQRNINPYLHVLTSNQLKFKRSHHQSTKYFQVCQEFYRKFSPYQILQVSALIGMSSEYSCEFASPRYFLLCGVGGIFACGTTHTAVTPLDLVKCRIQVNPIKYQNLIYGIKLTLAEEKLIGLSTGWVPTGIGYSLQGACKFGFYEVFKVFYGNLMGEERNYLYRTWVYLAAAASAEFFADIALCPFEAVKVKMQTVPGYPTYFPVAFSKLLQDEGTHGLYKSIVPLWMRQIPYTMMKFASFERTIEVLYKHVVPKPRSECTKAEQLLVTGVAGYIAGVFCAVVSHPADTLVSAMNKEKDLKAGAAITKLGFMGLWKGLPTRILMIGTLTSLQWFIYDAFKVYTRMPRPPPPEMPQSLKDKLKSS